MLQSTDCCPDDKIEFGHRDRKNACGYGGRDESDAATNHIMTKIATNYWTRGRGEEGIFPRTFGEHTALLMP